MNASQAGEIMLAPSFTTVQTQSSVGFDLKFENPREESIFVIQSRTFCDA
jgi:hypothetical protein